VEFVGAHSGERFISGEMSKHLTWSMCGIDGQTPARPGKDKPSSIHGLDMHESVDHDSLNLHMAAEQ